MCAGPVNSLMEEAAQGASLRGAPQALAVVDATDSPGERVRWLPAVRNANTWVSSPTPPIQVTTTCAHAPCAISAEARFALL